MRPIRSGGGAGPAHCSWMTAAAAAATAVAAGGAGLPAGPAFCLPLLRGALGRAPRPHLPPRPLRPAPIRRPGPRRRALTLPRARPGPARGLGGRHLPAAARKQRRPVEQGGKEGLYPAPPADSESGGARFASAQGSEEPQGNLGKRFSQTQSEPISKHGCERIHASWAMPAWWPYIKYRP